MKGYLGNRRFQKGRGLVARGVLKEVVSNHQLQGKGKGVLLVLGKYGAKSSARKRADPPLVQKGRKISALPSQKGDQRFVKRE